MSLWIIAAVVAAFFLYRSLGASVPKEAQLNAPSAKEWLAKTKDAQLVDVRSAGEFSQGHIAGAKLIPLPELSGRLSELDASKPTLVNCLSGHRSAMAVGVLVKAGFKDVKNLQGGISAWMAAGLPIQR